MSALATLAIGEITVRQHDGLFSLNDLHRASGAARRHEPGRFIRLNGTQELIAELGAYPEMGTPSANSQTPLNIVNDGENNGTYACRELVIAYAAWISAAFHLKVIRVFLATGQSQAVPAIDPKRIERARQLANAATAQVYQAVFDAVLNSNSSPYSTRLLLGFTGTTAPMAYVQALENDAFAMTLPQLTKAIRTDLMVSNTDLAHLAAACTQRMAERAEVEVRRNAKAQGQWQIQ